MIITKTPFRMSFLGGGTDYHEFFKEHGGATISTTFDKYVYLTVRHLPRFFDFRTKLSYSEIETVMNVENINHPLVRETMKYLDMHDLHIVYDGDLPARSGVGSSSAFACSMVQNFYALKGKYISKKDLAKEAIYIERELCKEYGGWQDQIASAYGGFNRINYRNDEFEVCPIIISNERKKILNDNLMLFFTGFTRISSEIASEQSNSIKEKTSSLKEMFDLVNDGEKILSSNTANLNEFGKILDYSWQVKRSLTSKISTSAIDDIYEKALKAGAIGGKIIGAGGGGFLLLYAETMHHDKIKEALNSLIHIPFEFENTGSQVLYFDAENYGK